METRKPDISLEKKSSDGEKDFTPILVAAEKQYQVTDDMTQQQRDVYILLNKIIKLLRQTPKCQAEVDTIFFTLLQVSEYFFSEINKEKRTPGLYLDDDIDPLFKALICHILNNFYISFVDLVEPQKVINALRLLTAVNHTKLVKKILNHIQVKKIPIPMEWTMRVDIMRIGIFFGSLDVVKCFIDRKLVDPYVYDKEHGNFLHQAAASAKMEMVAYFDKTFPHMIFEKDIDENKPHQVTVSQNIAVRLQEKEKILLSDVAAEIKMAGGDVEEVFKIAEKLRVPALMQSVINANAQKMDVLSNILQLADASGWVELSHSIKEKMKKLEKNADFGKKSGVPNPNSFRFRSSQEEDIQQNIPPQRTRRNCV